MKVPSLFRFTGIGVLLLTGCTEQTNDPTPTAQGFTRNKMLTDTATLVILPTYEAFSTQLHDLKIKTQALEADPLTVGDGSPWVAAQQSHSAAMDIWQKAELMQIGPAGSASTFTGGLNLRDEIYSWPTVNACRVDQEIVAGNYNQAGFFDTALVNVYGLDALEYLLHADPSSNACPPQVDINSEGTWNSLGQSEILRRRGAYANAICAHLIEDTNTLVNAWHPDHGNFLSALSHAGDSDSPYPTAQQAIDELYASLFYLELMVKDEKLAEPAGLAASCTTTTCPEALESQWAHRSKAYIIHNISGFEKTFTGGSGYGFDDLLASVNAPELSEQILSDALSATAAAEAIDGTLHTALNDDLPSVINLHDRIKLVTDPMKGQMVTLLNLTVPNEGAGDND